MIRPPIIGISGRARVGKDTLAEAVLRLGAATYRYGFADPLRRMLHAGFGIDLADAHWIARKDLPLPEYGRSPRQMLQTLGTEWGRSLVCRDVWVRLANDEFLTRGPGMCITDVRFDNEADWIRSNGGMVIHITRARASMVNAHVSEDGIIRHASDRAVANDGSLKDLRIAAYDLFHATPAEQSP